MYTVIEGGVTAAAGFETASTAAGIKYKNRKDMAMIYSEKPCRAAGTFTTNIVKAAPVKWDQKIVKESEYAQAVVINAGIANACTGAEGMGYCAETAQAASAALSVPESAVLVASTGVIGMQLPMDKLKAGESEADDYGFEFSIKHNIDPYAMYNALNKLLGLSAEAPKESKFQKMFSSHPDTAKRVARAKEKADNYTKNK